jgi:hypothetical protein
VSEISMPEISIGAALIHVTGVVACGQKYIVATRPGSLWHPHPKIYGICIFNNRVRVRVRIR